LLFDGHAPGQSLPIVRRLILKYLHGEIWIGTLTAQWAAMMTNATIEALAAINVGVINIEGRLEGIITLEEFVRIAKSQHVFMHTNAKQGEIGFDLSVSNTGNIIAKVEAWRKQQRKNIDVTGVVVSA
jgi:hypothetical protein